MRAEIVSNSCVRGAYYKLTFKLPHPLEAVPGQFFMVRSRSSETLSDPLLPRPFSIHRFTPDGLVEILYQVMGRGTSLLSLREEGEELEVLGPLGNGFDIRCSDASREILIVAGGIGVAPMPILIGALRDFYPEKRIVMFLGGRSGGDLLCLEELQKISTRLILATQDGSIGVKGYVTEAVEQYLSGMMDKGSMSIPSTNTSSRPVIYACGPSPMLRRLFEISSLHGIDTYFSLEATMACGIGLCMGCAVRRRNGEGYYLVCTDGPVFKGESVDLSSGD